MNLLASFYQITNELHIMVDLSSTELAILSPTSKILNQSTVHSLYNLEIVLTKRLSNFDLNIKKQNCALYI